MILDINPIHQDGASCIADIVIMVTNWLNRDYELIFSDSWVFNFNPEDDRMPGLLGNRINLKNEDISLLEKFCGISLIPKNDADSEKTWEIVGQELAIGKPTVIYLNSFWCPWHIDYQKMRHEHFCLIIGIDSSENLLCLDQISNNICTLSKNDFLQGCGQYFIFNFKDKPQIDNYHEILVDSVNKTINKGTFESIRNFIDEFDKNFNFDLEFENMKTNIWDVLIYRNLSRIAGRRKSYARFLELISKRIGFIEPIPQVQEFNALSSKWYTSRALLTRSYYSYFDQTTKNIAIELFNEILEKEEQLASSLLELRPEKALINKTTPIEKFHKRSLDSMNPKYTYLDLTGFFNNKAFGSEVSLECAADFTGTGYYFLTTGAPSGTVTLPDRMSFLFPEVLDGGNDNISCEKQTITISGNYHSIMLLGCGEYGNFIENLIIEYEDGEVISIAIKFTDWASDPIYGESIAWSGNVICKNRAEVYVNEGMNRIFAKEYQLPRNGMIKNIILPHCINIHIFAVTLCLYE